MEEREPSPFEMFGIEQQTDELDKKLFHEMQEIIHSYVTRNGHDYKPEVGEFRASSMGKCSRKILLDKDVKRYLDDKTIHALPEWYQLEMKTRDEHLIEFGPHIAGQVIHEVLQEALKARILSMEEEVGTEIQGARLRGHYDLLLKMENGEEIVIDIKTTSSPRMYLPKEMHLRQLMAYQGMMGGIRGAILYVNRESWEMSYVAQQFDKDSYSKLLVKLSTLFTAEKNGTLPPPLPEFDYECITMSYKCPYYNYCFPDVSTEQ
jgi:hypothetical protein